LFTLLILNILTIYPLNGIVENDEEFHETIVKEADAKLLLDTWKSFEGKMLRHILLCIIQI